MGTGIVWSIVSRVDCLGSNSEWVQEIFLFF